MIIPLDLHNFSASYDNTRTVNHRPQMNSSCRATLDERLNTTDEDVNLRSCLMKRLTVLSWKSSLQSPFCYKNVLRNMSMMKQLMEYFQQIEQHVVIYKPYHWQEVAFATTHFIVV